jgi:hypothetical protein
VVSRSRPRIDVTPERTLRRTDVIFLGILMIVAAGLRGYRLDSPLWYDEIVTLLDSVRLPLGRILTHFPGNNDHPLYSVLGRMSVVAFGEAPWTLRLPAVVLGIACVPMLYLLGVAASVRREAAAASLILTVSYHHIWFSQNARGYTALLFCALLSTYVLLRWFDTGRKRFLIAYAAATALGSYAHLTMVLVSVSQACVVVLEAVLDRDSRARRHWKSVGWGFVGAGALTVLLYAPMIAGVRSYFGSGDGSFGVATPIWALAATLTGLQIGFGTIWAIVCGAVVLLAGAWSYFRERRLVALLFLLPLPGTVLLALLLQRPLFPRFLFFGAGFVLLITVRGASAAGAMLSRLAAGRIDANRMASAMVVLLTMAAVLVSVRSLPYGYRYPKQDYEQAVAFVEQARGPTDAIALIGDPAARSVVDYLGRPWSRVYRTAEFHRLRTKGTTIWAIYTFPAYIEAGEPELWAILQDECVDVTEFEGTVAGGAISIRRCS